MVTRSHLTSSARAAMIQNQVRDRSGAGQGGDQTGRDPTHRGKLGTKRHNLSDANGIPLATTLSGANRHDMKRFGPTLDAVVVARPPATHHR